MTQQDLLSKSYSKVDIPESEQKIVPGDSFFLGGSCFADNLKNYLRDHFIPAEGTPFGAIYNPLSLRDCFALLCSPQSEQGQGISQEDLIEQRGMWRHSLFDTTNCDSDPEKLCNTLNRKLQKAREKLSSARYVVLTLGTAYVYKDKVDHQVVNNCHKRPGSDFERFAPKLEELNSALQGCCDTIYSLNPNCHIILTLSPVRHLRDKASENSFSKALLRCCIEQALSFYTNISYFPSYEIMMDELRDYRWYSSDLAHPSPQAVEYIMSRFMDCHGEEALLQYLRDAGKMKQLMSHKLRFPDSLEGLAFRNKRQAKWELFKKNYPFAQSV